MKTMLFYWALVLRTNGITVLSTGLGAYEKETTDNSRTKQRKKGGVGFYHIFYHAFSHSLNPLL